MRTRKCLGGLLLAAMAVSVGVLLAGRASAEQKVPVRTAVLTAHDVAAIQATPVHWVRGRYFGFYRGYYGPRVGYGFVYPRYRYYGYYRPWYWGGYPAYYPYNSYYSPYVYSYPYPYTTVPMALTPTGHVLPAAVVATPYGSYYW